MLGSARVKSEAARSRLGLGISNRELPGSGRACIDASYSHAVGLASLAPAFAVTSALTWSAGTIRDAYS